jgi:hypothetical protein
MLLFGLHSQERLVAPTQGGARLGRSLYGIYKLLKSLLLGYKVGKYGWQDGWLHTSCQNHFCLDTRWENMDGKMAGYIQAAKIIFVQIQGGTRCMARWMGAYKLSKSFLLGQKGGQGVFMVCTTE